MERTFANATLLSASVLAGFMLLIPIGHLSAQNEVKIDENAKFRSAIVENLDLNRSDFAIDIQGLTIPILLDASTTVYLGNGDETSLSSLKNGESVYIFGSYNHDTRDILAEKIIIRNKRITSRTSLSRAQVASGQNTNEADGTILGLLSSK